MSDFGTALRDLAREAEPAAVDPGDLWTRGRRRVRRRRSAAGGVVVVLALLAGLGGLLVPTPAVVMPAGSRHAPAVPKNVFRPPSWLAGTASAGPIGPLAVVGGMGRDGGNGLFGISATNGVYRALDVPGRTNDQDPVALAPDGRHLAYWITGPTSGKPYRSEVYPDVTGGFAVYDTVTGKIDRHLVPSEHGLGGLGLAWLDDHTLVLEYGPRTSPSETVGVKSYVWRVGSGDAVQHEFGTGLPTEVMLNGDGTLLARTGKDQAFAQLRTVPDSRVLVEARPDLELPAGSYTTVSRSGDHVIALRQSADGSSDDTLVSGTVGAGQRVAAWTPVTGLTYAQPLGWVDADTALLLGNADRGDRYASLYAVDLPAGTVRRLGTAEGGEWTPGITVAPGLLAAPMVHGDRPPATDPRWRHGLLLVVSVGAVLGLALAALRLRRQRA
jgi:hypothetical protein